MSNKIETADTSRHLDKFHAVFTNELRPYYKTNDDRVSYLTNDDLSGPLRRLWFPVSRLDPNFDDEKIAPYEDPISRFGELPARLDLPYGEIGWNLWKFMDRMIPQNKASQMFRNPFFGLLQQLSINYYKDADKVPSKNGKPSIKKYRGIFQPPFAEIRGSQASGVHFDRIYQSLQSANQVLASPIDPNLKAQSQIQQLATLQLNREIAGIASRGIPDIDIAFISPLNNFDPFFILQGWNESRKKYSQHIITKNEAGENIFTGRNYQVVEHVKDGKIEYEGWKLHVFESADDHTQIITIQIGTFTSPFGFKPNKENSLVLNERRFAIGLSAQPHHWSETDSQADRRGGDLVSYADSHLRLSLKSMSLKKMKLIVTQPELDWHLVKYGRNKMNLLDNPAMLEDKPRLIEVLTRSVKQMALRVGFFDVSSDFAHTSQEAISENLWKYINVAEWSNDLIYNIISTAHLSPIILAANLIPDSRLDSLPNVIKRKLAIHGIDYSVSLGNLWPQIFQKMSDAQLETFLREIPDQTTYINAYLNDPQKLQNQGLYHLIRALKIAGVQIPDFSDNMFLKAMYIFRHKDDNQPLALAIVADMVNLLNTTGETDLNDLYIQILTYYRDKLIEYGYNSDHDSHRILHLLHSLIEKRKTKPNIIRAAPIFQSDSPTPEAH